MEIQVPYNFTPRDYQLALFQAMDGPEGHPELAKKRAFLRWHRRSGKDKACFCYMISRAMREPGNYYYVFPLLSDVRRALWQTMDRDGFRILDHIPKEVIARQRDDEMTIELSSGSIIRMLGLDKFDKLRGLSARGVVFSEFAYQPAEGFKIFMPALRETGGWAIFNSTPNGKNHMYEYEERIKNSPNYYISVLQTYWKDLPNYSGLVTPEALSEIQLEEGFSQEQMEAEYGVSYTSTAAGTYYVDALEMARSQGRMGEFMYDSSKYVDTFWDLGFSDSTVIWFAQFINNRIVLIDYFEDSNKHIKEYVEVLRSKGYSYRTHYLPHDGSKQSLKDPGTTASQLEDSCKEAGLRCNVELCKKPGRVIDGINKLRGLMSRMYFNEPLVAKGLKHLYNYRPRFNKITGQFSEEAAKNGSQHAADALRTLAVADIDSMPNFRSKDIKILTDFDVFGDN